MVNKSMGNSIEGRACRMAEKRRSGTDYGQGVYVCLQTFLSEIGEHGYVLNQRFDKGTPSKCGITPSFPEF